MTQGEKPGRHKGKDFSPAKSQLGTVAFLVALDSEHGGAGDPHDQSDQSQAVHETRKNANRSNGTQALARLVTKADKAGWSRPIRSLEIQSPRS